MTKEFKITQGSLSAKRERAKMGDLDFSTNYFTCMLYPKEDPRHRAFVLWAVDNFRCCWITHDPHEDIEYDDNGAEVIDEETGEPKVKDYKEHCHFVWAIPNRCKVSTMRKEMLGGGFLVQGVRSIDGLLRYMVHRTYDSAQKGKKLYEWSDIKVNSDYFRKKIRQNEKQVQSYSLYMFDQIILWLETQNPAAVTIRSLIHHFWQDREFIYDNLFRVNAIVQDYCSFYGSKLPLLQEKDAALRKLNEPYYNKNLNYVFVPPELPLPFENSLDDFALKEVC